MKHLFTIFLVACLSIGLQAQNKLLHYSFDKTLNDISGNGAHGMLSYPNTFPRYGEDIKEQSEKALDCADNYRPDIRIHHSGRVSKNFTINMWINQKNSDEDHYFIGPKVKGGPIEQGGILLNYERSSNSVVFKLENKTTSMDIKAPAPSINEWHMYTISYNGDDMCLYIDGIKVQSGQTASFNFDVTWPATAYFIAGLACDARIDELCIYDGILTDIQVEALMIKSKVTFNQPVNGSIVVKNGDEEIVSGDMVSINTICTVEVNPADGYELNNLKLMSNDETIDITATKTFTVNIKDAELLASFTNNQKFAISFEQPQNAVLVVKDEGTAIVSGQEVLGGNTVSIEVTPEAGYTVGKITVTQGGMAIDITEAQSFELSNVASISVNINDPVHTDLKPIAHYKFDGNTDDASGNNNNAIEYKAPDYCADRNNNESKAASFGSGNDIELPKESYISLDEFTVNAWVYIENMTRQFHNIFGGVNFGNHNTQGGLAFGYRSDANLLYFDLYDSNSRYTIASELPASNEWHMYTITYDKSFMRFYIDGVEVANKDIGSIDVYWASSTTFNIGDGNNVSDFNGRMDDFRLYGEAISSAEVKGLMTSVPTAIDKPTTDAEVKIWPNPAKETVNVKTESSGIVEIINITGAKLHCQTIQAGETIQVHTSSFIKGIYLLKFEGADGSIKVHKLRVK